MRTSRFIKSALIATLACLAMSASASALSVNTNGFGADGAPAAMEPATSHRSSDAAEAAFEYGYLYAETIKTSLAAGKVLSASAEKHLNAEACLDLRVQRMLKRTLSREAKDSYALTFVSQADLNAYLVLAKGAPALPKTTEQVACHAAGLVAMATKAN